MTPATLRKTYAPASGRQREAHLTAVNSADASSAWFEPGWTVARTVTNWPYGDRCHECIIRSQG